jgi:hypothetical protein
VAPGGHVTTAETRRGAGVGVQAVYPHLSYDIELMPRYFATSGTIWIACYDLIHYREHGESFAVVQPRRGGEPVIPRQSPPRLRVHRLSIGSPMMITFAVEGGAAALASYTAYLFARVLRSPENIGAWLPRLVAGWHQGMQEAEVQKSARRTKAKGRRKPPNPQELREVKELIKASNSLVACQNSMRSC